VNITRSLLAAPLVLCIAAGALLAQGQPLPTSQPTLITIIRESVKMGRSADHERIEAGWPAAFAKAKSPTYYLAMTSLTGPGEAWFLTPYTNNAAIAADMKQQSTDTVLAKELDRLSRADAELLNDWRAIQARARPDLSHGAFPDLSKVRFWEVSTFRVRPGHEAEFEAAAKVYGASAERAAPGTSYRVYQVTLGMPQPTFLVFSSVESYGQFDDMAANGQKIMQGLTTEESATMQKFSTDALINSESNRFELNPTMSYVAAETRATDAPFWTPKRPARRP
jgi:hypothetical protein